MAGAIEGFNAPETKLYAEPFLGWRGWLWQPVSKRLVSLNGVPWEPGEELHAECRGGVPKRHSSPDPNCNCGIFSMMRPEDLQRHVRVENRNTVIGTIKVWGDVIVGSHGYRAEYAMIDSLYVPCSDAELEQVQLMRFMYDIDGDKNPTYLRSVVADAIEAEYGVTVFRHDPREDISFPGQWQS